MSEAPLQSNAFPIKTNALLGENHGIFAGSSAVLVRSRKMLAANAAKLGVSA